MCQNLATGGRALGLTQTLVQQIVALCHAPIKCRSIKLEGHLSDGFLVGDVGRFLGLLVECRVVVRESIPFEVAFKITFWIILESLAEVLCMDACSLQETSCRYDGLG